jgi:hypothetical protein
LGSNLALGTTAKPSASVEKVPELVAPSLGPRLISTVAPRTGSPVESFVTHTSVPSRDTFAEMPRSVICTMRARVARRSSRVPGRSVNPIATAIGPRRSFPSTSSPFTQNFAAAFFADAGRSVVDVAPSLVTHSRAVPCAPSHKPKTSSSLSAIDARSSARTLTAMSGMSRFSLASRYVPCTPISAFGQRSSKSMRVDQSCASGWPYSSRNEAFAPPAAAIVERTRTVKLFAAPKRPSSVTQLVVASSLDDPQFIFTGGSIAIACRRSRSFTAFESLIDTSDPTAHLRCGVSRSHASSSTSSGP